MDIMGRGVCVKTKYSADCVTWYLLKTITYEKPKYEMEMQEVDEADLGHGRKRSKRKMAVGGRVC